MDVFLYSGICFAGLANSNAAKKGERVSRLKQNLKQLRRLVSFCAGRYDASVEVLEAEVLSVQGNIEASISRYESAIHCALQENLWNLVALFNERVFLIIKEDGYGNRRAFEYLESAIKAYHLWGANAKLKRLSSFMTRRTEDALAVNLKVWQQEAN